MNTLRCRRDEDRKERHLSNSEVITAEVRAAAHRPSNFSIHFQNRQVQPYLTSTSSSSTARDPGLRQNANRNLPLLLPPLLSEQGHNLRAQRRQSLQILPLKMPRQLQNETQPAQTRLDESLPART